MNCQYKILKNLNICSFAYFAGKVGALRAIFVVNLVTLIYYVIWLQLSTNAVDNYVHESVDRGS